MQLESCGQFRQWEIVAEKKEYISESFSQKIQFKLKISIGFNSRKKIFFNPRTSNYINYILLLFYH